MTPELLQPVIQAINGAIHRNPAGIKADTIAALLSRSRSEIYSWGELGRKAPPLAGFAQFVLVTKHYGPISALCQQLGGVFVPLPSDSGDATDQDLIRTIKECSDVFQEASTALADQRIEAAELNRLRREIAEAQRAMAQLGASLEKRAQECGR